LRKKYSPAEVAAIASRMTRDISAFLENKTEDMDSVVPLRKSLVIMATT
jgi:hypothetical protein